MTQVEVKTFLYWINQVCHKTHKSACWTDPFACNIVHNNVSYSFTQSISYNSHFKNEARIYRWGRYLFAAHSYSKSMCNFHEKLHGFLFHAGENHELLSWDLRVYIALDVARGLEYLHDGVNFHFIWTIACMFICACLSFCCHETYSLAQKSFYILDLLIFPFFASGSSSCDSPGY